MVCPPASLVAVQLDRLEKKKNGMCQKKVISGKTNTGNKSSNISTPERAKVTLKFRPSRHFGENEGLLTKKLYRPGCIPHVSEEEIFSETRPSHFPNTSL